jgi:hypothetical protein
MADEQRFQFSGEFVPANTPPDAVRRTTDSVAGELNNEVQRASGSGDADRPRQVRVGQFSGEVVPATLSPEDVKQTTRWRARLPGRYRERRTRANPCTCVWVTVVSSARPPITRMSSTPSGAAPVKPRYPVCRKPVI